MHDMSWGRNRNQLFSAQVRFLILARTRVWKASGGSHNAGAKQNPTNIGFQDRYLLLLDNWVLKKNRFGLVPRIDP